MSYKRNYSTNIVLHIFVLLLQFCHDILNLLYAILACTNYHVLSNMHYYINNILSKKNNFEH